jgi:VTC domain
MRYEHKYLVPERLIDRLRRRVEPFVTLDPHVPRNAANTYCVRNIYFDDARFKSYFEKDDGIEMRAKPRIRGYNAHEPGAMVFLEVKRRHGLVGSKDRALIPFAHLADLFATGDVDRLVVAPPWLPDSRTAARKFLFHIHRDALRPVLLEVYDREPYVGRLEPSLRVTFDRRVRSSLYPRMSDLFTSDGIRESFARSFVLEVKHDTNVGFPGWLRAFIGEHGLSREALSKYWTCMTDWGVVRPHGRSRAHASSEWLPAAASEDATTHG